MARLRKFLALFLALTMTLSLMGITVLADDQDEENTTKEPSVEEPTGEEPTEPGATEPEATQPGTTEPKTIDAPEGDPVVGSDETDQPNNAAQQQEMPEVPENCYAVEVSEDGTAVTFTVYDGFAEADNLKALTAALNQICKTANVTSLTIVGAGAERVTAYLATDQTNQRPFAKFTKLKSLTLENVILPDGKTAYSAAFSTNLGLESLIIKNCEIGKYHFGKNNNMCVGDVVIEDSRLEINNNGFPKMKGTLNSLTLKGDVFLYGKNNNQEQELGISQLVTPGSIIGEIIVDGYTNLPTGTFGNGLNVNTVTFKNVDVVPYRIFSVSPVTTVNFGENVKVVEGDAFWGCTDLRTLTVAGDINETSLGFSIAFLNLDENSKTALYDRMLRIQAGTFSLSGIDHSSTDELTVPDGWTSGNTGAGNDSTRNNTQVTKAARWAQGGDTTAEIEMQFSYSKERGKDILLVLDYSGSMNKTAAYRDSKLFNVQSKAVDIANEIISGNTGDNRLAVFSFSGSQTATCDFTNNIESVENFFRDPKLMNVGSTPYFTALTNAIKIVNEREDKSREAVVIFITDGANTDGPVEGRMIDLKAISEVYPVLLYDEKTFTTEGGYEKALSDLTKMSSNGKYYLCENSDELSEAIDSALANAFGTFTITDTVHANFALDANSIRTNNDTVSKVTTVENPDGTTTITWTLTGAQAGDVYTLNFNENLKSTSTYGSLDTNANDATVEYYIADVFPENAVATPVLPRDNPNPPVNPDPVIPTTYTVTVNYVDDQGNTLQPSTSTGGYTFGSSYTVTVSEIDGYTFDHADGELTGTVNGNITVTLVYTAAEDLPDEDVPQTDTPETPDDPENPEIPDEEPPLADLPDEDAPTTDLPDEDTPTVELPDDDVPKTGDNSETALLACLAFCSGCGLLALAFTGKKKHE